MPPSFASVAPARRLSLIIDGHVQGVGFRYTAQACARELNLVGTVENLPDGSVRIVAEGEEEQLNRFMAGVRASHVARFITGWREQWAPAAGEFSNFAIRYG